MQDRVNLNVPSKPLSEIADKLLQGCELIVRIDGLPIKFCSPPEGLLVRAVRKSQVSYQVRWKILQVTINLRASHVTQDKPGPFIRECNWKIAAFS